MSSSTFSKVLIANRGEISLRILRTLKKMEICSVLIYSDADRNCFPVRFADEAYYIGPSPAKESYLLADRILELCDRIGVDAIHPGYGFLSENIEFALACRAKGIQFIGPTVEQIEMFGLKHISKELAEKAEVPLIPGSGILRDVQQAQEEADRIGYPVMLKSSAGGGGIGMRLCKNKLELLESWENVKHLSQTYFGNPEVFVEKYISRGRHVEVQIFGDGSGNIVTLGTRDCSTQRRNQKVIEEAPAPNIPPKLEHKMIQSAKALAESVQYQSAGTVEFIYDVYANAFYFLEVNTRLQVEHCVTEEIYQVDLVEWMIRQASDPQFLKSKGQELPSPTGHAIEVRWYAEDPLRNFAPSTGTVTHFYVPNTLRCDTWLETGQEVSPFYDPLLAKLITSGTSREEAITRLQEGLRESRLDGINTNMSYLQSLLLAPDFRNAELHTKWVENIEFAPCAIEVLDGGAQTTVQDYPGRVGHWEVGVPPCGPMDNYSFQLGNKILGNTNDKAGLEITLRGPHLKFHQEIDICISGALLTAELEIDSETKIVSMYQVIRVPKNAVLKMGSIEGPGMRSYVLFSGGIDIHPYLGSRSTFTLGKFGGLGGRTLRTGDTLPLFSQEIRSPQFSVNKEKYSDWKALAPDIVSEWNIRVLIGPHTAPDFFTKEDIETILSANWEVHFNSNRTGVRLVGPKPTWARSDGGEAGLHPSNIHDNAYAIGSMDFTGDIPVLLGPDGPSLGGFVCPLTIIQADLWKLGQLKPGDKIQFLLCDRSQADYLRRLQIESLEQQIALPESLPHSASKPLNPVLYQQTTEGTSSFCIRQAGDAYILMELGELKLDLEYRFQIQWIRDQLEEQKEHPTLRGILDITPGVRTIQIHFDPDSVKVETLVLFLVELKKSIPPMDDMTVESRKVRLPLSWDDESIHQIINKYIKTVRPDAPWCPSNIEFIRRVNGLESIEDVKNIIFSAKYLVLGLGDVYLGAPLSTPLDPRHRLVTTKYNPARTWTLDNVVGIGGAYLCIYGMEGPGGYQLFGRTCQVWNSYHTTKNFQEGTPWLLRLFDQIEFYPVSPQELTEFRRDFLSGQRTVEIETSTLNLGEYKQFLETSRDSIELFKTTQQQAFEEERLRWEEQGFEVIGEDSSNTRQDEVILEGGEIGITAPMPGNIWKIDVQEGDIVKKEDSLFVLESMKMEFLVSAPEKGTVSNIFVKQGQIVEAGQMLGSLKK